MPLVARSLSGNVTKVLDSLKRDHEAKADRDSNTCAIVVQDFTAGGELELSVVKGQRVAIVLDPSSCSAGGGDEQQQQQYAAAQWCLVKAHLPEANGSADVPAISGFADLQSRQQGYVPSSSIRRIDSDNESCCGKDTTSELAGCCRSDRGGSDSTIASSAQQPSQACSTPEFSERVDSTSLERTSGTAARPNNLRISKMFTASLRKLFPAKVTTKKTPKMKYDRSATFSTFYDSAHWLDDVAPAVDGSRLPEDSQAAEERVWGAAASASCPAVRQQSGEPRSARRFGSNRKFKLAPGSDQHRPRSMSVGQLTLPASLAPAAAAASAPGIPCQTLSVPGEGQPAAELTSSHGESDLAPVSPEEIEKCQRKRSYVLQELLDTERIYVADLGLLVEGYMEEIKQMACLPESFQGKDKIVFGNIHQIYDFHRDTFLPEIEKCLDDPHRLGIVFRRYENRLYMYVKYCENKPKSECIVMDNEAFFEELRRKLNHKLQIADLLIKPVQRIMKYQLLLKEVHKFSQRCMEDCTGLDGAIQVMHVVPKAANDMMNVGRLQGFNGSITAQGKLLHQDKVTVVELGAKSDQKPRERHIFLFEQIIIFSEAVERKSALAQPCYIFKNALKVNRMSLENCGGGGGSGGELLRFMLVDRTPRSDLRFILQPADLEARTVWLEHINSMLAMQRDLLTALQSPIAFQKVVAGGSALPHVAGGPALTSGAVRKGSQS